MTASSAPAPARELRVADLTVRYDQLVALREVSLQVAPGEILAIRGPSGAGKSTLLWALAGAVHPDHGAVFLGEEPITDRAQAAGAGIALIPQGNGLAGTLTAAENIVVPLIAAKVPATEAAARAESALSALGLEESGNHIIEELSGGQQQRVAVARGLACRATVLLADEPTSDLDAVNRGRVMSLLRAEADRGAVVVFATHDPEAAAAADRVITLDEGSIAYAPRHGGPEVG